MCLLAGIDINFDGTCALRICFPVMLELQFSVLFPDSILLRECEIRNYHGNCKMIDVIKLYGHKYCKHVWEFNGLHAVSSLRSNTFFHLDHLDCYVVSLIECVSSKYNFWAVYSVGSLCV